MGKATPAESPGLVLKAPALAHRKCATCGRAADVKAIVDLTPGAEQVERLILVCRNDACPAVQEHRRWPVSEGPR